MRKWLLCIGLVLCSSLSSGAREVTTKEELCDSLSVLLEERGGVRTKITLKRILKRGGRTDWYFKENLGDYPFRKDDVAWLKKQLRSLAPAPYKSLPVDRIFAGRNTVEQMICAPYTRDGKAGKSSYSLTQAPAMVPSLVRNASEKDYKEGLSGRHIALWNSHGYYFSHHQKCWMWQRPPLFGTLEDVFSTSFVIPFLVPMLENAGAVVLLPRERDFTPVEAIADNDSTATSRSTGRMERQGKWEVREGGFADTQETYTGTQTPFGSGTCLTTKGAQKASASLTWHPNVPRKGEYSVYVCYPSFPESTTAARYTVHHRGGSTLLLVNQQMGGGTWIHLGRFEMDSSSFVRLDNKAADKGRVSGDAVRVGGGMGNIARYPLDTGIVCPPAVSGKARWTEGARYWLQWAGADSTVYSQNKHGHDYRDDFMSRGAWVGWLSGGSRVNPKGYLPPKDADGHSQTLRSGLNIPLDVSFALHTNAGYYQADSTYGTLAIYTLFNEKSRKLPSGEDRQCQRELADLVQSQVVDDIRAQFHPEWRRRELWDRSYSESRTPAVPAMLLELLSHQSFNDMKQGLDPAFRFCVARSIYKGLLKYLSARYRIPYRVQPLPVKDFAARLGKDDHVTLSWYERTDSLEPTAGAEWFILSTRIDEGGFDKGRRIEARRDKNGIWSTRLPLEKGHRYAFRIMAANEGGCSFPSETLSAGLASESKGTVLILNNFDRISGPAGIETEERACFDYALDGGVGYGSDCAYIGDMYESRRDREWLDDHCPGFGASWQEYAGQIRGGNRMDYPILHGEDFFEKGYSYCSSSASAYARGRFGSDSFFMIDLICGKQTRMRDRLGHTRYEIFPAALRRRLDASSQNGTNLLVSGSYIASDSWDPIFAADTTAQVQEAQSFARNTLGWRWMTGRASRSGRIWAMHPGKGFDAVQIRQGASFCTDNREDFYRVESPDGLVPAQKQAQTIFRYQDNNISAGVAYQADGFKAVSLGFPLESMLHPEDRKMIIDATLAFFNTPQ
ncbi:MAG: xanthan lyase [Bacteroidales bacterium]|nr:xanthan lyase [Bacteroidales bacterium]